jgi:hypothetical protein
MVIATKRLLLILTMGAFTECDTPRVGVDGPRDGVQEAATRDNRHALAKAARFNLARCSKGRSNMKIAILVIAVLLVSGCVSGQGSKIDGTYCDSSNGPAYVICLKFRSNGTVLTSGMGIETELKYEVDGDKIKIMGTPQGSLVLTMLKDGSIQSGAGAWA